MSSLNKFQFGNDLSAPHRHWIAAQERQQQHEQRFPREEPNASGTIGFAGLASDALEPNRNRTQPRTRLQSQQQQQTRNDASASDTDTEALDDDENPFAMSQRLRPLPGLPFRERLPYMGRLERERKRQQCKHDTEVIAGSCEYTSHDGPQRALEALRPSVGTFSEDVAALVEMMAQRRWGEAVGGQCGEDIEMRELEGRRGKSVWGYRGEIMDDGDKELKRTQDGRARVRVWPDDTGSWTGVGIPMWKAEGVEGGGGVETKGITDKGTEGLETGARAESEPADTEWDFVAATGDAEVDEGEGDDWCVVEKHLQ